MCIGYRCNSGQNKNIHFQKREQKYFSAYHKHRAHMQPVCTTVSTPCHAGRGLAGHPRCVSVGNNYGKTRLYSSIRSKTTALPWCARHHSAQRGRPSPPRSGDESPGIGAIEIVPPAKSESGFYRRYFLIPPQKPQKRRRPATYSGSQTPELCPDEKVVQDDHFETNPLTNMPGSCRWI